MQVARILVSGNRATVKELDMITSGTVGATVSFEFDETWDGFIKAYIFRSGSKTLDDVKATGIVPAELLQPGLRLEAGVYGTKGDIAVPTIWADLGIIRAGADPSGDESTDPSPPVWAQLQEEIDQLKEQGGGGSVDGAVLYTAQDLTEKQQAQTRENIGAVAESDVKAIIDSRLSQIVNAEEVAY